MNKRTSRHLSERPELTVRGWAALGRTVTARDMAQDALRNLGFNASQLLALRLAGYGVRLRDR